MVVVWVADPHGLVPAESTQLCVPPLSPGKGDQVGEQCQTQLQAPSALRVSRGDVRVWGCVVPSAPHPVSSCPFSGEALGISSVKMEVATGSAFSGQVESHELSRTTAGTIFGLLFGLLLLGVILFLNKKRKLRYGRGFCWQHVVRLLLLRGSCHPKLSFQLVWWHWDMQCCPGLPWWWAWPGSLLYPTLLVHRITEWLGL